MAQAGHNTIAIGIKFDQPGLGLMGPGGKPAGFDVDVATYVAKYLGYAPEDITWVQALSSDREKLIEDGKVDFVVASCVLTVILACVGVPISVNLLWVPPIVALLILLTAGLAIFLSAAGLFFRDVKYLVEIFVMFAIFVTPVFFSASILGRWEWVLLLNPVAPLLEGMSDAVVLGQMPNLAWLGYSMVAAVGIFGGAVAIFRRLEAIFAECI